MNMLLTIDPYAYILKKHSQKTSDGIGVPELHGVSRYLAVFLRSKSQFIVMLDWVRPSKDGLVPCIQYANLIQFDSIIGVMWSGLKFKHGGNLMPKTHGQEPIKTNKRTSNVSLTSLFSLFDSKRKPIATSLTFDQVKPISEHIPHSVIKFERMTGRAS